MIGTSLQNRYRLEAELGRGGMGVVYRGHDTLLNRDVAVKVLSEAALGSGGRARLLHEAQAAAQLHHPNIASVFDAGETDGIPFVVMELVEGESMHTRRPQALNEILSITGQVCAALEHAHVQGIIHRDLKPENILLTATGTAKLVDFGLARTVASRLTSEGAIVGTVYYLAPEQALGQQIDGRADLYALGVMLYEITTGEMPFDADDPLAIITQHLHAPVVPPRAKNADIPTALDRLIVQLLSKAPEDRPASAEQVRRAVEGLASGQEAPGVAPEVAPELAVLDRIVRGRLVARDSELAQARALWRKAASGEGQVLLVSGEPGIGKTRLVRELMTQAQVAGSTALLGECYAEGGAPYAPFAQILRRTFQNGADQGLDLPDFVLADLLGLAPGLRPRFPHVPPNPPLDAKSEQQRLFENMVTFCQALCDKAPLLLVLEDAHWADSGSLALLRHLARRTRRSRILLVATYREVELDETRPLQEVLADLNRERLATRLKLSRLDQHGTRDMLAALFADEITPEFLGGIYRETEGNPFFVEEVCKALVESGQVCVVDGRWDRPSMEEMQIPQSVRVAIQSRLGKLPGHCQDTLHLAAIVGREFQFDILAEASAPSPGSGQAQDEEALIDALECAVRAQLIDEVSAEKEVTFAFTHGLIPATLAEGVNTLRRRRLHRRVAAAIQRLYPDDFEALAHHYAEAGDEEQALIHHTKAGERASAAYANAEAEHHFRAALELVEDEGQQADLLSELGRMLSRQSRYEEAIEVWQQGIAVYTALDDRNGVARLYARTARAASAVGDTPRGLALCREGMAATSGAPESPEVADLLHETARACHFNGLPDEATPLCHQALQMAGRLGAVEVQVEALCTMGVLPGQAKEEMVSLLTRAVELAESAGMLDQAARAHNNLGVVLVDDRRAAREHFLRAAALARQRGEIAQELFYAYNATHTALWDGEFALAEHEVQSHRELLDTTHEASTEWTTLRHLEAMLLRFRGELAEAIELMRSVQAEVREAGNLQRVQHEDVVLADALLELGQEDEEVEAMLQEAITLGDQGMPSGGVWPRCLLSVMYSRLGATGQARSLISEGREKALARGVRGLEARELALAEAHLATAEQNWSEAWAAFEAATDACARAEIPWYRARTLCEWAGAYLSRGKAGDRERAEALLREAEAEFEAMGVPIYAAQVQERLKELETD